MAGDLHAVFARLRAVLGAHAAGLVVAEDSARRYELAAAPGPATLQAWGGKLRRTRIPVAWVALEKGYVGYHLMPADHPAFRQGLSQALAARLDGKTCFDFDAQDQKLFAELADATARGLAAFREAGFIATSGT